MRDKKIRLFDVFIMLMIVSCVAFYDIKGLFIATQVLALVSAIPIAIKNKVTNSKIVIKYIIWSAAFIIYGALSILWASEDNKTAATVVLSTIQVFLLSIAIITYCSNYDSIQKLLKYIVYGSTFLVIRFVLTIPVSLWGNGERFSKDTIFGSNMPAIVLAYASVILLWKILTNNSSKRKKVFLSLMIIIFMSIALLMGTKKSILIFLIGLVTLVLFKSKNLIKVLRNILIITVFILGGYFMIQNIPTLRNSIGYRIDAFVQEMTNDSTSDLSSTSMRKKFIGEAMHVFSERPMTGIGQDGFRYRNIYEKTYSHCNYSEILANLGLIGFLIYYSVYILIIKNAGDNRFKGLIVALTLCMLFVDIGAVTYSMELSYILFGLIIGMLNIQRKEKGCIA